MNKEQATLEVISFEYQNYQTWHDFKEGFNEFFKNFNKNSKVKRTPTGLVIPAARYDIKGYLDMAEEPDEDYLLPKEGLENLTGIQVGKFGEYYKNADSKEWRRKRYLDRILTTTRTHTISSRSGLITEGDIFEGDYSPDIWARPVPDIDYDDINDKEYYNEKIGYTLDAWDASVNKGWWLANEKNMGLGSFLSSDRSRLVQAHNQLALMLAQDTKLTPQEALGLIEGTFTEVNSKI